MIIIYIVFSEIHGNIVLCVTSGKGPFKYYVIKEVGGWGQKVAIFDDLQYCKSSKRWVVLKKSKTWWRNTWMVPSGTHRGGFQFMVILDLWGISFHAVVVFGLGKNLLFKYILGRCAMVCTF